jgi:membrane protein
MFIAAVLGISVLYRYGPSRERAKWRWVTWGSAIATVVWIIASVLFSWYLTNFADYNATYGSLGAVIGFMMWTWISVTILIVGAELNAEIEHQTARDSTTGPDKPMGARGATMADTIGKPAEQARAEKDSRKPLPSRSEVGADNTDGSEAQPQAGAGRNRIAEKRSVALAVPFYTLMAYLRRRRGS